MGHDGVHRLLLLSLLVASACGDNPDPATDAPVTPGEDGAVGPRETVTRSVTLNGGGAAEPEVRLNAPTDKVHFRVTVPTPSLAWNIHTHVGGETQVLVEESGVDHIDHELTGVPGDYWLLLVNGGNRVTFDVNIDLYGEAAFTGGISDGISDGI